MLMDARGKAQMFEYVDKIQLGSGTNLCHGLVSGLELIENYCVRSSATAADGVTSLLLMTDGLANEGYTATRDILKFLTPEGRVGSPFFNNALVHARKVKSPNRPPNAPLLETTVYTFGFGADHNAGLLQAISEAGGGMYYFIDSAEKIPESFADCLGGLLSTVGQNITMEVKSTNDVVVMSAFSGRDKKSSASGATCTLPLGDIQADERRDILLKLKLPKLEAELLDWQALDVSLLYFNVITSTMEIQEARLSLSRPSMLRGDLEINDDVGIHKSRVMAVEAMQEAMLLAESGAMARARGVLQHVRILFFWLLRGGLHYVSESFFDNVFPTEYSMHMQVMCQCTHVYD